MPYADPALRGVLPDMQTVHCILGILLLVGAVVWSTHRTGRFLTRETEKLTAAAQAVARKDLDSAVFPERRCGSTRALYRHCRPWATH